MWVHFLLLLCEMGPPNVRVLRALKCLKIVLIETTVSKSLAGEARREKGCSLGRVGRGRRASYFLPEKGGM